LKLAPTAINPIGVATLATSETAFSASAGSDQSNVIKTIANIAPIIIWLVTMLFKIGGIVIHSPQNAEEGVDNGHTAQNRDKKAVEPERDGDFAPDDCYYQVYYICKRCEHAQCNDDISH